jgi:hypothetical protein
MSISFITSFVSGLKTDLSTLGKAELTDLGSALTGVIPAILSNPTKAGLIEAAAPAVIKIAAAQPQLLVAFLTDLFTASQQIQAAPTITAQTIAANNAAQALQQGKVG